MSQIRLITLLAALLVTACQPRGGSDGESEPDLFVSDNPSAEQRAEFGQFFEEYGVRGSILLYDMARGSSLSYNQEHIETPFIPASTFKILNSLIALEEGVVSDAEQNFVWDGVDRGSRQWNQDHTLETAFRHSVVWVYQELARQIGTERMQHHVDATGYGNRDISGGIDTFWLNGGLTITSEEQLTFLRDLHAETVPFSPGAIRVVKDIMVRERTDSYVLRGKSGWDGKGVGWFVGYVEEGADVVFFVTNLVVVENSDLAARESITRKVLAELGFLGEGRPER